MESHLVGARVKRPLKPTEVHAERSQEPRSQSAYGELTNLELESRSSKKWLVLKHHLVFSSVDPREIWLSMAIMIIYGTNL